MSDRKNMHIMETSRSVLLTASYLSITRIIYNQVLGDFYMLFFFFLAYVLQKREGTNEQATARVAFWS